jgi:hypothetical protein
MRVLSPTLYLRDRSLGRIGRRESCLLSLAAILGRSLTALCFPRALLLLVLLRLLLLLVPGLILGPELLVLWDWGRESLTIPIPCKRAAIKAKVGKRKNKRKIKEKGGILLEKCSPS